MELCYRTMRQAGLLLPQQEVELAGLPSFVQSMKRSMLAKVYFWMEKKI